MKLGELAEVAQQPIVCLDGLNGKIIFKRYTKVSEKSKLYDRFNRYKDVEVLSVWSEIVADKPLGFVNIAKPVLKCYLNHCALREVLAKENEKINGWTFEETIKTAENLMETENNMFKWDVLRHLRDFVENFKDELEQYRAIGKAEEVKYLVDSYNGMIHDFGDDMSALEQYRAIGTIEEFKVLKEKSVAKKPIRNDLRTCPSCGTFNEVIEKRRNTVAFDTVYCWHCGQAIEIERD